ncbi:glycosyltransferase family 4 protein [Candidatus Amesbacteria bacterium]|nr:glycosyltransferase family 4 protein [Candidatus Amesbacteria bacterium]
MIKVGFVTKSLTDGNAQRGVGFYAKRLLPKLKEYSHEYGIEICEIENSLEIENCKLEIVHYPYFDLFYHTLPLFRKSKTVVTLHDVIPLEFQEVYKQGLKAKLNLFLQGLALQTVDAVITDSFYSLKNIRKYLNIPHEKLKLVYLAADEIFKPKKVTKKYNLPKEFVLYVGDVNYNKNIPGLIEACKLAKLSLVMVGRQAKEIETMDLDHPELCHLKSLDLVYPLRLGFVSDEDLVDIYNLASVYCQASFSEGFGLNPLEALACGTPVASSNHGSLPEILGDSAVYFDPYDVKAMSQAIITSMKHKSPTMNNFTWDKTAKETLTVYKSLCP